MLSPNHIDILPPPYQRVVAVKPFLPAVCATQVVGKLWRAWWQQSLKVLNAPRAKHVK
jgi:hypothetical protein